MKITVQWLGGSSVRISWGDFTLIADPLLLPKGRELNFPGFSSIREDEPAGTPEIIGKANHWLFTHKHKDHWDSLALESIPREGRIICHSQCHSFLRDFPNRKALRSNKSLVIEKQNSSLEITALSATHCKNPWLRSLISAGNSYALRLMQEEEEYRIFLTGDSHILGRQHRFFDNFQPHLILANSGLAMAGEGFLSKLAGPLTLGKKDLLQLAQFYPNSRIVPIHWGTFSHYREKYTELDFQLINNIRLLEPGDEMEIERS